jgi:hypothetical protein
MTCIFLNKGFKQIPIVLRRGGGGWTRPEYFEVGGPHRGREIYLKTEVLNSRLIRNQTPHTSHMSLNRISDLFPCCLLRFFESGRGDPKAICRNTSLGSSWGKIN